MAPFYRELGGRLGQFLTPFSFFLSKFPSETEEEIRMPGYGGKYLNKYSDVLFFLVSKTGAIAVTTRPSPIMCAERSQFLPAWLRSQSVLGERL